MFKIEKNVEIPPRPAPTGRRELYPLSKLSVGDSFEVPARGKREKDRIAKSLANIAWKRLGPGICTVRQTPKGVRVWRVK